MNGSLYCVCSAWLSTARRGHSISTAQAKIYFVLCSTKSCRGFLVAPGLEKWRGSVHILGIRTATKWVGIAAFLCSCSSHTSPKAATTAGFPKAALAGCTAQVQHFAGCWRQGRLRMLFVLVFKQMVVSYTAKKAWEMYKTHTGMFITPCSGSRCDSLFFLCVKTRTGAFPYLKQPSTEFCPLCCSSGKTLHAGIGQRNEVQGGCLWEKLKGGVA